MRFRLVGAGAEGEIVIVADGADGVVRSVRSVVELPATASGSRAWMKMPLSAVFRTTLLLTLALTVTESRISPAMPKKFSLPERGARPGRSCCW